MEFVGNIGTNTGDVVYTLTAHTSNYIEYIFTPTAGVLTCELYVKGTWYPVAMEDMASTAPSTFVSTASVTTQLYRVTGRVSGIRFKQSGATAANVEGIASN